MSKGHLEYKVTPKCIEWKQMFITSDRLIIPCCHTQTAVARNMYMPDHPNTHAKYTMSEFYWFLE